MKICTESNLTPLQATVVALGAKHLTPGVALPREIVEKFYDYLSDRDVNVLSPSNLQCAAREMGVEFASDSQRRLLKDALITLRMRRKALKK